MSITLEYFIITPITFICATTYAYEVLIFMFTTTGVSGIIPQSKISVRFD